MAISCNFALVARGYDILPYPSAQALEARRTVSGWFCSEAGGVFFFESDTQRKIAIFRELFPCLR